MRAKNLKNNSSTVCMKQNIKMAVFNPEAPIVSSDLGCKKATHGLGHYLEQRLPSSSALSGLRMTKDGPWRGAG